MSCHDIVGETRIGGSHFQDGRVLVVVRRAGTDKSVFCVL